MKTFQDVFFAITVVLCFTACTKEVSVEQNNNTDPATNATADRVKTYRETRTSPTLGNWDILSTLSYDSKGRLISMISDQTPQFKMIYSYPANNKVAMEMMRGQDLLIHEDFYLNSNSLIDSTFQYNDTQDSTTEKYIYSPNGQISRIREYSYSRLSPPVLQETTVFTYDANGNCIKQYKQSSGETTNFEYYNNLVYKLPNITPPINPFNNKKLPLTKKKIFDLGGGSNITSDLTYTFDSKDRISTIKESYSEGTVVTMTFTYF